MKQFKDHKVQVKSLLKIIPENLIEKLAQDTKVDHYAKVLTGKNLFYLLLYGILENDKLSQRSLEDTFNDPVFKTIFALDKSETVRRNSISERLAKINSEYFKQIFESIYAEFSKYYSLKECENHNIIRVDSSLVTDTSGRIEQGLKLHNQSKVTKKVIKYTVTYDGLFPCNILVFNEDIYASEDIALPEAVKAHSKLYENILDLYTLDRGLQSLSNMDMFCESGINFVCRIKVNRKYKELRSNVTSDTLMEFDGLELLTDSMVNLYSQYGKSITQEGQTEPNEYRLVVVRRIEDGECFWFITNATELSAREISSIYKRRWDIEVFFRFIKQELNVPHLVSLSKNGIEVMIYMTFIASMLLMIYKRKNKLSYTTAKRRFLMELRNEVIANIVEMCGGDPSKFFSS